VLTFVLVIISGMKDLKLEMSKKYLKSFNPVDLLRTKKVLKHNPNLPIPDIATRNSVITMHAYTAHSSEFIENLQSEDIAISKFEADKNYWLNLDIINQKSVEDLGNNIGLHPLIIEDILSDNQRPKADEIDNLYTCVLHMLYYNEDSHSVESEQVTFVLGKNFLITFQDDAIRDLFDPIRERIKLPNTRIRLAGSDYLMYSLIDIIVDNYFVVLDKLALQIEEAEEKILTISSIDYTMKQINEIRKELMFFKRNVTPVRELLSAVIRSETVLIHSTNIKYFKDIYDHIVQANDLCETYRDVIANIRDLYFSRSNMKMNEVMKFLAIVTTLLAPATVIGGIFGMNFDKIPYLHDQNGFWIATFLMISIPVLMLYYFHKKGWF
jgi:magnesium transporter